MTESFPYPCLSKQQLIGQMNLLASTHTPFFFLIDYKAENGYAIQLNEMDANYIQFQFEDAPPMPAEEKPEPPIRQWDLQPLSLKDYQPKFDYVQKQIHAGNSFLVNLTQPTKVQTNLSLYELYSKSRARYKVWVKDSMLVLSPETFVRIEGQSISSFPMKGTIDAAIPDAEEVILNDPKEMAEHATIVDLIRNDLSLVADHVEVKRFRYVEKIKTNKQDLLQVSSEITGLLPADYLQRLGTILFELLPAGSISGAPKAKTLEIIQQAEGYDRGYYTGICGHFDGENLNSGVMIRFLEQVNGQLVFKSGGGITAQSELIKEYEELIQKVYVPVY
ncbi:MAG: aminodeoxychorismate synthase component I [Paludibacter sp.]|nr:aminodeoxychorismate synthase component I [Paludibacter sp.]